MLVLNMKVNPSKLVADDSSTEGIYGAAPRRKGPEIRKPVAPTDEIVFEPPVFEPVTVTTLTKEEKKYAKKYVKMHNKKDLDASEYKIKIYIAERKKPNWFNRLFAKIEEFFRKLFKRKKKETNERDSEDIDS